MVTLKLLKEMDVKRVHLTKSQHNETPANDYTGNMKCHGLEGQGTCERPALPYLFVNLPCSPANSSAARTASLSTVFA